MKKIIAIAIAAVLLISATVYTSIAYLADVDSDVNVMTMGDVEIEQIEMERAKDENGNWIVSSELDRYDYYPELMQEFTQNRRLMPAFYDNAQKTVIWDDRATVNGDAHQQSWEQIGAPGSNQLFDDSVKNVLDKFVFVKNTGNEDAYYRTLIAIECPEGVDLDMIHLNLNNNVRFSWENVGFIEIDGVRYFLMVANYLEELTPGEVSRPSLLQVYLDPKTETADVKKFNGAMEIFVVSQAVQCEGFERVGAIAALDEAFGDVTIGAHPWTEAQGRYFELPAFASGMQFEKNATYYIQDESIYNGVTNTDLVFDGNGATVHVISSDRDNIGWEEAGATSAFSIFASEKGSNAVITLKDMTVTGNATFLFGTYVNSSSNWYHTVLENVHMKDIETVTSLRGPGTFVNSDGTTGGVSEMAVAACIYGTARLNNCSIKGTSFSQLEIDDFEMYAPLYDLAVVNNSNTVISGGEYGSILTWQQLYMEINNAKVDLIDSYVNRKSSNTNAMVIGAGTEVGTLRINAYKDTTTGLWSSTVIDSEATVDALELVGIFDANDRASIVIEDGATIGSYSLNGQLLTAAQFATWLADGTLPTQP